MQRRDLGEVFVAVVAQLRVQPDVEPVDGGDAVLEVQPFERVDVHAQLSAIEVGLTLLELERLVARDDHRVLAVGVQYALVENVVRDHVVENAEGNHDVARHIGQPQVFLEAELRFEVRVADLVDVGPGVYAVGRYLRNVRRAIPPGEVELHGKLVGEVVGGAQAPRYPREYVAVVGEGMICPRGVRPVYRVGAIGDRAGPGIQSLVVKGPAVETDAAGNVQFTKGLFGHRKGADIE